MERSSFEGGETPRIASGGYESPMTVGRLTSASQSHQTHTSPPTFRCQRLLPPPLTTWSITLNATPRLPDASLSHCRWHTSTGTARSTAGATMRATTSTAPYTPGSSGQQCNRMRPSVLSPAPPSEGAEAHLAHCPRPNPMKLFSISHTAPAHLARCPPPPLPTVCTSAPTLTN